MVLLIVAILISLLLAVLLFSPIVFTIDTRSNEYYLSLKGLFRIQLLKTEETWRIKLKLLFLSFTLNPFRKISFNRVKKVKPKNKYASKSKNPQKYLHLIRKAVKAISIKKLYAEVDTNDYPLNAQLITISPFINQNNISLNINFENRNSFDFKAITYLYKLIGVAITTYIFKN